MPKKAQKAEHVDPPVTYEHIQAEVTRIMADARAAIDNLQKHQQILADAGFFRFKREIVLCENINGRLVFDSTGMLSEQLRSDVMQYPNSPEFTYAKPISYEEAVASYDLKDCAKNIFATLKPFGEHMASTRQNSNDSLETIKLIVEENKQLNPKSAG